MATIDYPLHAGALPPDRTCRTCRNRPTGKAGVCLLPCKMWSLWEPHRSPLMPPGYPSTLKPSIASPGAPAGKIATTGDTPPMQSTTSLPDDAQKRLEYPMADGLLDYFPNALAEVSRLSFVATAQHHPDAGMHWDRSKSTDHANKIMRHLVDRGKLDDKGMRHSAMVAWRALAMLQEELERAEGLPPSRASRNRPEPFAVN